MVVGLLLWVVVVKSQALYLYILYIVVGDVMVVIKWCGEVRVFWGACEVM